MESATAKTVWLKDYQPYPFELHSIELHFELDPERTSVRSIMQFSRRAEHADTTLHLDGSNLELDAVLLNDEPLSAADYELDDKALRVLNVPDHFTLCTQVFINPRANQTDEGLFEIHERLATQCESEGFRKITFFPDRPDVLTQYKVTLVGDKERYPLLLSNGHLVDSGEQDDGRHWCRWEDPFAKPCYIFAVVAGDFGCLSDSYQTGSGRHIELNIYADHDRIGECDFAMGALKRSLLWEEQQYQREYDLDLYNIVALTGHVGAMENKGLNIFDANGICADPEISTDQDYSIVERILAHEVFHNWTGNRVTCRDWFQLSLKEGLTRFRDQCFSQDMAGGGHRRIEFVRALQRNQYPEDDGPAVHAVRPDHYAEIRNFYTGTVYEKGAEVIRMMRCLLGDERFREGVRQYLSEHDGEAVCVEDFVAVMQSVSGQDLQQFFRWYGQAGRPQLEARGDYDSRSGEYRLTLTQHTAATPGQAEKLPFHIPVRMELLSADGHVLAANCPNARRVDGEWLVELRDERQTFVFQDVASAPIPSLLRGFSAPVSLDAGLDAHALGVLWAADSDAFNQWQSGQRLAVQQIRELARQWHIKEPLTLGADFEARWAQILQDSEIDASLRSELLTLPDEPVLSEGLEQIDLDGHRAGRNFLIESLARTNGTALMDLYLKLRSDAQPAFEAAQVGRRALMNTCLELLLANPDDDVLALALAQVRSGENMTAMFSALAALCHVDSPIRQQALDEFYQRWQHKPSVIDKWFNAQSLSRAPDALDAILALEQHPDMDLMNLPRAMAFYGGFFRQNRVAFHQPDGRAYDILAERLIFIDSVKPGSTYWLMPQLLQWRRLDSGRREKMRAALEHIQAADISNALRETVDNALAEPG